MKACVNEADCIGCQFCADLAPEDFGIDEGVAFSKSEIKNHNYNAVQEAVEGCPTGAISIIAKSEVA